LEQERSGHGREQCAQDSRWHVEWGIQDVKVLVRKSARN
jgi:hypothetical protein